MWSAECGMWNGASGTSDIDGTAAWVAVSEAGAERINAEYTAMGSRWIDGEVARVGESEAAAEGINTPRWHRDG